MSKLYLALPPDSKKPVTNPIYLVLRFVPRIGGVKVNRGP